MTPKEITVLLHPYYPHPTDLLLKQLSQYLDLLLKWNARTNLTAIRDPEEIVRLHFGESLFVARHLVSLIPNLADSRLAGISSEPQPSSTAAPQTLLDLGSGAGFPGIPVQLAVPELRVVLAESQTKKSTFLREVIRTLSLPTEVWPARVETLPASRLFDFVTLRAVDDPTLALELARTRLTSTGLIAHLTTGPLTGSIPIPNSTKRVLHLTR